MTNPQISFRLTPYQLACGLKIIRTIEPNYRPASLSQLVKTFYINYLAKTALNKTTIINDDDLEEIRLLTHNKSKAMSFSTFQEITDTSAATQSTIKNPGKDPTKENI